MPTALVTGGNRGIGREVCRQLAERGYQVWLCARTRRAGEAVAEQLSGDVQAAVCDVSDRKSRAALVERLRDEGVALDVLVNNAGVALRGFDAEVAARTLEVNFRGPLAFTDALVPLLAEHARVVMVSSGMGELAAVPGPLRQRFADPALDRVGLLRLADEFQAAVARGDHARHGWPSAAYSVSKMLLNGSVRVLDRELAGRAVLVNAVCPGWVQTDMGGEGAPRSVVAGAASVTWAATLGPDGPRGGFFRDGQPIDW